MSWQQLGLFGAPQPSPEPEPARPRVDTSEPVREQRYQELLDTLQRSRSVVTLSLAWARAVGEDLGEERERALVRAALEAL